MYNIYYDGFIDFTADTLEGAVEDIKNAIKNGCELSDFKLTVETEVNIEAFFNV